MDKKAKEPATHKKGYRIYFHKGTGKFMVNLWFRGENIHVGYYLTYSEAVTARDEAITALYGEAGLKKLLKEQALSNRKVKRLDKIIAELKTENIPTPEEEEIIKKAVEVKQSDILDVL